MEIYEQASIDESTGLPTQQGTLRYKADYRYDALDRRTATHVTIENQATADRWEFYVYDGAGRAAVFTKDGANDPVLASRRLVTSGGELLAEEQVDTGGVLWPLTDAQRSTIALVGYLNGTLQWRAGVGYDALGKPLESNLSLTAALYAGRAYDAATQLYDYGGRTYDAGAGRFINVAPRQTFGNPYHNSDLMGRVGKSTANLVEVELKDERNWFEKAVYTSVNWLSDMKDAAVEGVKKIGAAVWNLDTAIVKGAGQIVRQAATDPLGFAGDVLTGMGEFVLEAVNLVAHPIDTAVGVWNFGKALATHPLDTIAAVGDGMSQELRDNPTKAATKLAADIFSGKLAAKVLGVGNRVSGVASKSDELAAAGNVAKRVDNVATSVSRRSDDVYNPAANQLRVLDDGPSFLRNGGCFAEDTLVALPGPIISASESPVSAQSLTALEIVSVALGSRVIGENPRPWEVDTEFPEPEAASWVRISATVRRSDGATVEMDVLRPGSWAEANGFRAGANLLISYPELKVNGEVRIRSVSPAPEIAGGEGHVVTGRFVTRDVANLIRLTLSDGTLIDVTDNHPIWSADRSDWIPAEELAAGERLDASIGTIAVESAERLGHAPAVYNLEVHGQHVFRVAKSGILVHNTCPHSHHIVSRYANLERGWEQAWSVKAQDILDRAGIGIESQLNRVSLYNHHGPHPELYHKRVFQRLDFVAGRKTGKNLASVVQSELERMADELRADPSKLSGVGL